ncbi:putative X-ray repair cross-complementing protein 6 [Apostichopus japonicus]|uniref:DNA helicase n=1 Tax=Stichopus japonicus TaxID=307972 RepID=A0A2G8L8A1_STIJA|nr:putative X-ray repair cross-complementing protein 6 [Apostichopus japonicus]
MANWNFGNFGFADGDGDEEDDAETGFSWKTSGRDSIILLVDVTRPMFIKQESGETHFELCMKCAQSVLKNKVISSDRDLVGIVFFGTEKEKNSANFKHIYVLQELEQPCASRILELEGFLQGLQFHNSRVGRSPSGRQQRLDNKYGHNNSFSLSDALWACSNMFSQSPHNLGSKRVLLFTCNDNPHSNDPALQRQARTKAKDLHEVNVDIELLHLSDQGKEFKFGDFYQDIVYTADDEDDCVLPDASGKLEELMTRVRAKDNKKRTMGKIGFELGDGLQLECLCEFDAWWFIVSLCVCYWYLFWEILSYIFIRDDMETIKYNLWEQRKPYPTKLYARTNEPLKKNRKTFCEDTGELLMQTDIKKFQTYSGRKIVFEQEEVASMKSFDEPGSTTLFNALLKKSLSRDVIAICRFIPRRNSAPQFVALLPQEEELDDQNIQLSPPGFHVIFLPFADDIRRLQYPDGPRGQYSWTLTSRSRVGRGGGGMGLQI